MNSLWALSLVIAEFGDLGVDIRETWQRRRSGS